MVKMSEADYLLLPDRGVLGVEGADARTFLQGLISNDVRRVSGERAIYAALLTPQGKFLHDFFVAALDDGLVLECERDRLPDLQRRLGIYKLRSQVALRDRTEELASAVVFGPDAAATLGLAAEAGAARPGPDGAGVVFVDPRHAAIGVRAILSRETAGGVLEGLGLSAGPMSDYESRRIALALPDGSRDMEVGKAILLENGFDELHGVDWGKGCFMGQELTARTRYRGLIKKRLVPVEVDGPLPAAGTPVLAGARDVGEIRSTTDGLALALVRLDALEAGEGLTAGAARLIPKKPSWAAF